MAGLKTTKGHTHFQVDFLPCVDRQRFVAVWLHQRSHRALNIRLRDCRELSTKNLLSTNAPGEPRLKHVEDFEADVLALAITIKPEHQVVNTAQ